MERDCKYGPVLTASSAAEPGEEKPRTLKRLQAKWKQSAVARQLEKTRRRTSTWRFIILAGLIVASVVLIFNVALLVWATLDHPDNLLFQGDCGRAKSIVTYSSLAINGFSTLLLGASNAAMQCLCAPTRAEVDRMHAKGSWLDIGVSGLGNLKSIERWRQCAWAVILISSLPLHLLFNSVIYSTSQANEYFALLVTNDFIAGNPQASIANYTNPLSIIRGGGNGTGESYDPNIPSVGSIVTSLHNNLSSLQRLENADCIQTYGTDYVTDFLSVLLVTDSPSPTNESVLAQTQYYPASDGYGDMAGVLDYSWICNGNQPCDIPTQASQASNWNFTIAGKQYPISHCLAQPIHPQCTVEILRPILGVVIACNALKVLCFTTLLFKRRFWPLMLFGDAIASFMTTPDPDAITYGPVSAEAIRKMYIADPLRFQAYRNTRTWVGNRSRHQTKLWCAMRRRWASAVGPKRWGTTVIGFVILWFTGFGFLYQEQNNRTSKVSFSTFWTQGFGTPYPLATVQLAEEYPIIAVVILANLPQIVLSVIYLCYNDVFTCMLVSVEFLRHSIGHKGLRVTFPKGEQRSTYTLSLPLKVSVPLLIGAGVLHWAMSQSLFLARVNVLDPYGNIDPYLSFSTLGWSALALLILLIVWGLMLVAVIGSGFRNFRRTAPVVGSNSRAILCASGFVGNGAEEALKKVRYGVIGTMSEGHGRVGFTSGDAGELSDDEVYA